MSGSTGGSAIIAARSSSMRSDGRHRNPEWIRTLALCSSQSPSWVLKSSRPANRRPGRKLVSKYPLARSTHPLRSGWPFANTTEPIPNVPFNRR
jgi:hypothetical protein